MDHSLWLVAAWLDSHLRIAQSMPHLFARVKSVYTVCLINQTPVFIQSATPLKSFVLSSECLQFF